MSDKRQFFGIPEGVGKQSCQRISSGLPVIPKESRKDIRLTTRSKKIFASIRISN